MCSEDLANGISEIEPGDSPWFLLLRTYAAKGIMAQERRDTDILAEDGTMWCSVCGEPRRKYQQLQNGDHITPLLTSCKCRCDREKESLQESQESKKRLESKIADLYSESLMDGRFRNCTFDKFSETKDNAKNKKICLKYATCFADMEKKNQGLLMHGEPGTGKTFAAACIANHLLSQGISVVMTSFVKILSSLDNDPQSEEKIMKRLQDARLLIIDDLGAERSTEYALEKVYNIIDTRYREGKPMILTTNLTPREMSDTADVRYYRIYDRVWEVCYPMKFTGDSWRLQEASGRYKEMEKFLTE